ncbi:MAG: cytochrome c4 [Gammaproteobacteria bacterium]|nr:cytochrome c4 [Gammaproteobacteria bacterium]MCK5092742.1 cytochrome c4 [Gammaproteobacteria bacterium]
MKKSLRLVVAIFSGLLAVGLTGSVYAGGDAMAGKDKSLVCAGCHGADGNSFAPNFPKLAGQHENYLIKQLKEFKSGVRKDSTGMMLGMVAGLGEQDMADISAYFASQKIKAGTTDSKYILAGTQLYKAGNTATDISGCMGCHGPNGAGNPDANFPAIGGQHADYVAKQLKEFRNGSRVNDTAKMMQNITARMTDADIEALSSYITGLN